MLKQRFLALVCSGKSCSEAPPEILGRPGPCLCNLQVLVLTEAGLRTTSSQGLGCWGDEGQLPIIDTCRSETPARRCRVIESALAFWRFLSLCRTSCLWMLWWGNAQLVQGLAANLPRIPGAGKFNRWEVLGGFGRTVPPPTQTCSCSSHPSTVTLNRAPCPQTCWVTYAPSLEKTSMYESMRLKLRPC